MAATNRAKEEAAARMMRGLEAGKVAIREGECEAERQDAEKQAALEREKNDPERLARLRKELKDWLEMRTKDWDDEDAALKASGNEADIASQLPLREQEEEAHWAKLKGEARADQRNFLLKRAKERFDAKKRGFKGANKRTK